MDRVLIIPPVDFSPWDKVTASASIQERPSIYFVPLGSPPTLILILLAHTTDFFFFFSIFYVYSYATLCTDYSPYSWTFWIGGLDEAPATAPGV